MNTPVCSCPTKYDSNGAMVRAYLDANCPVHAQPAGVQHCPTCNCGGVAIIQTPEIAAQATMQNGEGERHD